MFGGGGVLAIAGWPADGMGLCWARVGAPASGWAAKDMALDRQARERAGSCLAIEHMYM